MHVEDKRSRVNEATHNVVDLYMRANRVDGSGVERVVGRKGKRRREVEGGDSSGVT